MPCLVISLLTNYVIIFMAFLVINELGLVIITRLSKLVSTYLVGSPDPQELNPFT